MVYDCSINRIIPYLVYDCSINRIIPYLVRFLFFRYIQSGMIHCSEDGRKERHIAGTSSTPASPIACSKSIMTLILTPVCKKVEARS